MSPGSAAKIIDMVTVEQKHRHRMDLLVVLYPYLGFVCGLAVAVLCFALGHNLAMNNHPEGGGAMIGVSALGVIGWFIKARLAPGKAPTLEIASKRTEQPKRRR